MPLNVSIRLGADTFHAAGDVTIDAAFLDLFRAWVNAVSDATTEADAQITALNDQSDQLAQAVADATPQP